MNPCKLIIKDEINIRIEGLPVDIRRKLVSAFKFIDPSVKYTAAVKLGRWDGSINFFGIGGDGYLYHLPKIITILQKNDYEITELEDLRNNHSITFPEISTEFWGDICWPKGHQHEGKPIRIREDQVEAINLFLKNPQSIQQLSTGYGKTILISTMVKICEPYGRTLTIVPNKSLVEQTEKDFINCGLDVGVYYGGRKDLNKTHTICTWQSLNVLDKKTKTFLEKQEVLTLDKFLTNINTVIVDECHALKGVILKNLITKRLNNCPIRWGLTGTVPKEDFNENSLYTSIGPLVNKVLASELQEKGILSTCHIHIKQLIDIQQFKDYHQEHKFLVSDPDRICYISGMIKDISQNGNTLVLVNNIETGKLLQKYLKEQGIDAAFVKGSVKSEDRREEYDAFETETSKILIATYGVAAVGINIISLYNLVLIESGKSFIKVIQSIGRGLRKGFDKDHVNIYDITSSCKYSKRHLTERKAYYKEAQYPFTIKKIDWNV